MEAFLSAIVLTALTASPPGEAIGFAHNRNFVVFAPDQSLAEDVLAQADALRKRIAIEWFGEELPAGAGAATLNIEISDSIDDAHTWPIDHPGREFHLVWMTVPKKLLPTALAHEVSHVVLATRNPKGLPRWLDEGAASMNDDAGRLSERKRTLRRMAESKTWPNISRLLKADAISQHTEYALAVSLTQFLLARGDRAKLFEFASHGPSVGWDVALQRSYDISSVSHLQREWQSWVATQHLKPVAGAD